ncbi:MAG: diphthine--ammonia ligase [Gemmatimonadales bacterium]|nr:MAG: diphthine--ammonia ligase [Gemmatimonadales bacterium]
MPPSHLAPSPPRTVLAWSSGKDCAYALHHLRATGAAEVVALLTTVDASADDVPVHGTPLAVLRAQAASVGLPLLEVPIAWPASNVAYEAAMAGAMARVRGLGADQVAFGDLFLEDVRAYREAQFDKLGMKTVFPLWGRPTDELAREIIAAGFEARIVSCDAERLPVSFLGRVFDLAFLEDLPEGVDPCGEGGEFHTLVTNGPIFRNPISGPGHPTRP